MEYDEIIARALQDKNGVWRAQHLTDHLDGTAKRAGDFAAEFGNRDWGECLGWWHDLGKFHPIWQRHIRLSTGYDEAATFETAKGKINHSTTGAILAMLKLKESPVARILAYILAGHHAGLPDWLPDKAGGDLCGRLYQKDVLDTKDYDSIAFLPEFQFYQKKPFPTSPPSGTTQFGKEFLHLWIRMLFSCLVDADYLDTEAFMQPEKTVLRGGYRSLAELQQRFVQFMKYKEDAVKSSELNQQRRKIREQCIEKAGLAPGFFSLTVPTGGGKTLSSMAFALEHVVRHNKHRIIYAIPYTSIIEQTAKVFKYGTDMDQEIQKAIKENAILFGEDQVIEHHSQVELDKEDSPAKLACENWDAPLIVTTNVQLFESLFATKTSACRKLHNVVNSVIILDEVQMLPPEYLKPLLSTLRGMVQHFGVSVVLMTATQPALEGRIGQPPNIVQGLENVRPIIEDPVKLAQQFDRVEVFFPEDLEEPRSWESIRDELIQYDQVLCIVNSRKDCRDLHALMPEGTIHLSALMCAEERSHLISNIKLLLKEGAPLRVVSTQLVEAGVDIDFPVVYRALAGLDSIAQAAGRCNRENRLAESGQKGKVVVFVPPQPAPVGILRKGQDACKELLRTGQNRSLTPALFRDYFRHFYAKLNSVDKPAFYDHLVRDAGDCAFQFRTLANDFHLIDDAYYQSVVIHYGESPKWIASLKSKGAERWLTRKLQRFMVNIPWHWLQYFIDHDMVETINGYYVQTSPLLYECGKGVRMDDTVFTEQLMI